MGKKLNYSFVKNSFNNEEYELLSDEYINSCSKLKYKCPNGHVHDISWNNWYSKGARCPYCHGNNKLDIDYIRAEFNKVGYDLLSKEYKNSSSKLKYVCKNGHVQDISWDSFKAGHGCPTCANNIRHDLDYIKSEFSKRGYKLLSNSYVNNKQKLKFSCSLGHIGYLSYSKLRYGRGCKTCAIIAISGNNHYMWSGGVACDPMNLITVCRSCNARANTDRKWHEDWYNAIMFNRYGGTKQWQVNAVN